MILNKVLLADTDEDLLALHSQFLRQRGFQVSTAKDGLECVAQLRAFRPHILVLNPELPWGSGEGVLAMMYEEADVPFVPVVALACHFPEDGMNCIGVFPVSGYQLKPLPPPALEKYLLLSLKKYWAVRKNSFAEPVPV